MFNYIGPNEGQGIRIYQDGNLMGNVTTLTNPYSGKSSGKIVIGRRYPYINNFYSSVEVDELLFFNQSLTEPEITTLSQNTDVTYT